jgi:hypothetical protein
MLNILLIILLLFFILILGAGAFLFSFIRRLFGGSGFNGGFKSGTFHSASNGSEGQQNETFTKKSKSKEKKNKGKIFSSDEGTYIDFVEVKE